MTEYQEQVFAALDRTWLDLHELTQRIDGPTKRVYQAGRYVEVSNTASGSGLHNACEALVAAGRAERQQAWKAPMGVLYRRAL